MDALIPYDPKQLFSTNAANTVTSVFARSSLLRLSVGEPLSKSELKRMKWYPRVAAAACNFDAKERIGYLLKNVLTEPRSQFLALVENYDVLRPHLERFLLGSPEFTFRLMRFMEMNEKTPQQPAEVYYNALRKDPNYYVRFCGEHGEDVQGMIADARANRFDSAAAAFFYIQHSESPVLDDDLVNVLCTSEEYALRTAFLVAESEDMEIRGLLYMLLGKIKNPRYMLTGLYNRNFSEWHKMWANSMVEHGAWFVEFVENLSMPTETYLSLQSIARDHFYRHELRSELLTWLQYRTSMLSTPMTRARYAS